jgi:hypothetical protein
MSAGGTKYDIHVVEQKSRMGWVAHVTQRNAVPKVLEYHCDFLTGKGYAIKRLRCNNAGEHQTKLKKVCTTNGIDLEYMPQNTPQMNGVVERRIVITNHSTFTMLHGSKLKEQFRLHLRAEAKTTANKLKNLYVTVKDEPFTYVAFWEHKPKLTPNYWKEFGRVGYVTDRKKIKRKGAP